MAIESETVRSLCPCGATVDWGECPYPAGRDGLLHKIVCVDPECGWTMVSSTPEGAIAAWNRRAPSAEAKDGYVLVPKVPTAATLDEMARRGVKHREWAPDVYAGIIAIAQQDAQRGGEVES